MKKLLFPFGKTNTRLLYLPLSHRLVLGSKRKFGLYSLCFKLLCNISNVSEMPGKHIDKNPKFVVPTAGIDKPLVQWIKSDFVQSLNFCNLMMKEDFMENRGYKGWGIKKLDNRPVKVLMSDCEDPQLFAKCYNMFIGGYSEEEVAAHFEIPVQMVERAIQHTRSCLSGRTIIAHNNDRLRILVQRTESEKYRKLLGDALSIKAEDFLKAGIAPTGTLKEFRQCVGLEEKPGGIGVNITHNTANFSGATGGIHPANLGGGWRPRSFEDLLRAIIQADPSCSLTPIDVDAQEDFSNGGSGPSAEGTDQPEKNEASEAANAPNNEEKWHCEGDGRTGNAPYSPDSLKDIQTGE
jgi:hypothetical protein